MGAPLEIDHISLAAHGGEENGGRSRSGASGALPLAVEVLNMVDGPVDAPRPPGRLPPLSRAERWALFACLRKRARTEPDARAYAAERGLAVYPCPLSQIVWHWHVTSQLDQSASEKWWATRQRWAVELDGMGYPDGWVIDQIRAARDRIRANRAQRGAA